MDSVCRCIANVADANECDALMVLELTTALCFSQVGQIGGYGYLKVFDARQNGIWTGVIFSCWILSLLIVIIN